MKNVICDLHVHSGLKGFGTNGYEDAAGRTIWDHFPEQKEALKKLNFALKMGIKDMAKESQANLSACANAGLRVPFIAMYPIERQMFALDPQMPFRLLFNILLKGNQHTYLGAAVTGFPIEKVKKILANVNDDNDIGVDYFKELMKERNYLISQTKKVSPEGFKFEIARDYDHLQELIRSENTIASMLTVEGAHSFGHYLRNSTFQKDYDQPGMDSLEKELLRTSFQQNIATVKQAADGNPVPFFVTFCHHFNNLLAGHARSFSDKKSLLGPINGPNLPGLRHLFNQEPGLNKGFSKLGWEVMQQLYDKKQGRRILIDAKHMSVTARKELYQYIRTQRETNNDPIPIIQSHAAINGWPTLEEAARHEENGKLDKGQFFSRWQINLTNEDILEMYDSDGLIGVVLHEGRMPGDGFKKEAKKLKKKIKRNRKNARKRIKWESKLKDLYLKLIWSNIFHIVKTIRDQRQGANGWKMIALGSDYDGLVDPIDSFDKVGHFKNLKKEMADYLSAGKEINYAINGVAVSLPATEASALMFGQSPEEITEKVFSGNVDQFLAKYFTPAYLDQQAPGHNEPAVKIAA